MISLTKLLFELLEVIIKGIVDLFFDMIVATIPTSRQEDYDARFIKAEDILFRGKGGICVDGLHALGEHSFKHAICFGITGAYKTSSIIIPTILGIEDNASLVVIDPGGETLKLVGTPLQRKGKNMIVINFRDPIDGYNPFDHLQTPSDINAMSKTISGTIDDGSDKFFLVASQGMISTFSSVVIKTFPPELRNLNTVYHLINTFAGTPEKVDKIFARSHDQNLIAEYKAYVNTDSKLLMSIITSAKTALQIFNDPAVALTTSIDTIGDFKNLRHEPTAIFLTGSIPQYKQYSPVIALFIDQLLSHLMNSVPKKTENAVYILLDEAGNTYFNSLPTALAVLRKHRVGILMAFQHKSQLKMYGDLAGSVYANTYTKIFLGGGGIPLDSAEELSRTLGQFEYNDVDGIRRVMPLMTPDSLRQMNDNLILIGSNPPIKTKVIPYFKNKKLLKLTHLPEFIPQCKIPYKTAPQLNLD